jgi:hypothetical protein
MQQKEISVLFSTLFGSTMANVQEFSDSELLVFGEPLLDPLEQPVSGSMIMKRKRWVHCTQILPRITHT